MHKHHRYYLLKTQRDGSVLIMVILMMILMVSMATSFLSLVGRQLGSALSTASQTKADVAAMQAQAHVIKTALENSGVCG